MKIGASTNDTNYTRTTLISLRGSCRNGSRKIREFAAVFKEIMATSDRAIPHDLLQKAECVVIVPGMKKGAFIVGANFGRGYFSCRKEKAGWSAPGGGPDGRRKLRISDRRFGDRCRDAGIE